MDTDLQSAIEEMLEFWSVEASDIEYNCGTILMIDKTTGKKLFLSLGECEGE